MYSESSEYSLVLIGILVAIPVLYTAWQYAAGRWLALDPLNAFWAGLFIVYVHQPLSSMSTFVQWHGWHIMERSLTWAVVSAIFVIVGYESKLGEAAAKRLPPMPARLNQRRLSLAACICIALGLISYWFQFQSAGGIQLWLSVARGGTDWVNLSGYVIQMAHLLPVGVFILILQVSFRPTRKIAVCAAWVLGILVLLWFVYLGSRSRTIVWTSMLLVSHYLPRRRNPPVSLLLATFICLFAIVMFQRYYRGYFVNLSFNLQEIDRQEAIEKVLPSWIGEGPSIAPDVSVSTEFNCVMATLELVPSVVDYNYASGYLEIFTRPIPRAIWPSKTYPAMESIQGVLDKGGLSGAWLLTSKRPLLMGPAFSFVGHWYYVGGPIAIVLAALLTGALFRGIRRIYERSNGGEGDIILYSQLLTIGFFEAAGWPLYWLFTLPVTLVPLLIFLKWCKSSTPILVGPYRVTSKRNGNRMRVSRRRSPPNALLVRHQLRERD